MSYDVIIVGAGPASIFAAYELTLLNPRLRVLILEKDAASSRLPDPRWQNEQVSPCSQRQRYAGCVPACSITTGWGGRRRLQRW